MTVTIEWLLEEVDGEEIIDVHHAETYAQANSWKEDGTAYRLGLVKDRNSDRSWAYIENGNLPEHFTDAWGEPTGKVPSRYRSEMAR